MFLRKKLKRSQKTLDFSVTLNYNKINIERYAY